MNAKLVHRRLLGFLPGCGVLFLSCLVVQGVDPPRGKPIQFADPSRTGSVTNLDELSRKADSLNPYRQEGAVRINSANDNVSYQPVLPNSLRGGQARSSKQTRELLERRRNWASPMSREELMNKDNDESLARIRGKADGEKDTDESRKLSPEEKFYLGVSGEDDPLSNSSNSSTRDPSKKKKKKEEEDFGDQKTDDPRDPANEREGDPKKKTAPDLFAPGGASANPTFGLTQEPKPVFSDFFNLNQQRTAGPDQTAAQKATLNEWRRMWGIPASPGATAPQDPFKTGTSGLDASRSAVTPLPSLGTVGNQPSALFPENRGGIASSPLLPEVGRSMAMPSLVPSLPSSFNSIPAAKIAPPAATFTAPKRVF